MKKKEQHVGGLTQGHPDPIYEGPGTVHSQLHEGAQKQDLQHTRQAGGRIRLILKTT